MEDSDDQYEDYHDDRAPQFTKILDLTNGEGGERRPPAAPIAAVTSNITTQPSPELPPQETGEAHNFEPSATADTTNSNNMVDMMEDYDEDDEDEEDEVIDMAGAATDQPRGASRNSTVGPNNNTKGGGSGGKITVNPNTPGKVVESGQEQTGRWTKHEHEAFLEALRMYGKEWKKVAAKVKTRTVVQTRTHAQKYFQKLQKLQEASGGTATDVDFVDMGIACDMPSATKPSRSSNAGGGASGQKGKKQKAQAQQQQQPPSSSSQAQQVVTAGILPPVTMKGSRRGSASTLSAAQAISNLSGKMVTTASLLQPSKIPFAGGGSSSSAEIRPMRPQHAFTTAADDDDGMAAPSYSLAATATGGWAAVTGASSTASSSSMKIVAPDPMSAFKKGKFPEPSPAATGKRKLAEIAAARMLAGVAGVVVPLPLSKKEPDIGGPTTAAADSVLVANNNFDQQNDMMDDLDEGAATPPPESDYDNENDGRMINLNEPPLPPLFVSAPSDPATTILSRKQGLSLQIVNPESLGVTHEKRRKVGEGDNSPVTPWDGQLEALVNEKEKAMISQTQKAKSELEVKLESNGQAPAQERKIHAVCGPGSAFGRSALHCAVCEMDIEELQSQLDKVMNRCVLSRLDNAGFSPLHTAASLRMAHPSYAVGALEMVRTLLGAGADANIRDQDGNTPLHWAARAGDHDVVSHLLIRNSHLDAKNKRGETPLHWAMRAGPAVVNVITMLVDSGARVNAVDSKFKRPIDVAAEGYLDDEFSIASLKARDLHDKSSTGGKMSRELKKALREKLEDISETRNLLFERSTACRTLVLHHPECLEHVPKSQADWEAPDRVVAIMTRVSQPNLLNGDEEIRDHEITLSSEFERANLDLLSRVHSTDYLHFVQNLSKDLEKQVKASSGGLGDEEGQGKAHVVPFTPMVQRSMIKVSESDVKSVSNSDTAFSAGSLRAARRAAGAVQHAVDCVLVGRNRNSFCVVRPPGHHAGVNGLLDGGESCGFCIFNNVAAGALYAISDERLLCERCAIVDIDVHHGNGTEEIVRKCHDPSKLFFFSIHLYDNDKKKRGSSQYQYKFYPGTGSEDDLALNIINVPIVPLWKEVTAPSPPVTRTHNTRQKARTSDLDEESPVGTPRKSGQGSDAVSESGSNNNNSSNNNNDNNNNNNNNNVPSPRPPNSKYAPLASGRLAYRDAIRNRLLPALRAFNPDLILISAGFDAAKGDVGNARHERGGRERIGLDLVPEDYAWTTRKILEIADICCSGKVVSVLEGGYGKSPPSVQTESNTPTALDRTIFSECAVQHLHALIDPYDLERRFSSIP
ncbi:hypothetical protein ACA910_009026 [Epithemia clementina (nom. ined.)]